MAVAYRQQDPDAKLDHSLDWSDWLGQATISTSAWTAETGLTLSDPTNDTTSTTVWVEIDAGVESGTYLVKNSIVDSDGREADRTIAIEVQEQ